MGFGERRRLPGGSLGLDAQAANGQRDATGERSVSLAKMRCITTHILHTFLLVQLFAMIGLLEKFSSAWSGSSTSLVLGTVRKLDRAMHRQLI
jgi:hypothetical protein